MGAPSAADASYTDVKLQRVAFGSCHSRRALAKRLSKSPTSTIWDTIASTVQPQTFLWTGDAIYPKIRGDTPLPAMQNEYHQMLHNETLGYARFIRRGGILAGGVHGTWDDHDYGGNDRGRELPGREARRDAYLEFLGSGVPKDSPRWQRDGVYSSVEFGEDDRKVKVIFLDTRWHREKHCIPSVGSTGVPFGALIACATRWLTAGLDLQLCPRDSDVLGEKQWAWLEQQLKQSDASVHVIVSSIQLLTSNPVVESWGHFPGERERLLKLLNEVTGLVVLSGDVHHAEISSTPRQQIEPGEEATANRGAIVEVTSSGLTHACDEPFYGPLCKPILDAFPAHRFNGGYARPSYFTSRNFGSIDVDWESRSLEVRVHNDGGDIVLTTGSIAMDIAANLPDEDIGNVSKCIDGHLRPIVRRTATLSVAALILACLYRIYSRRRHYKAKSC